MGFEKEKLKQIRRMILYIAFIVLVLIYSDEVFGAIGVFVGFMKPFLYGGVIAFILNIPLRFTWKVSVSCWTSIWTVQSVPARK